MFLRIGDGEFVERDIAKIVMGGHGSNGN